MELITEIFDRATLLMDKGEPLGNGELLLEVCEMAAGELEHRLKDDTDIEDIHELFVRAAGVLAVSMLLDLDINKLESFSAGSVQVQWDKNQAAAGAGAILRQRAELLLLGYLNDDGFAFRTVKY